MAREDAFPDPEPRRVDAALLAALVERLALEGYGDDVTWSETVALAGEPEDPDFFAREAIFVIANSGMRHTVARGIFERAMGALLAGEPVLGVFGHKGKAAAMEYIWAERARLLAEYRAAPDKLAFCGSLPWIGGITRYHLAKNFGVDCAKPDVHLQRLADRQGETVPGLCARLAAETGYRIATVDLVLWRACATGLLDSPTGRVSPAVLTVR